jgi:hypothetical protein
VNEPFRMADLLTEAQRDIDLKHMRERFLKPMLVDLRAVDLLDTEAQEIRNLIWDRRQFARDLVGPPAAFVARNDGSYGMLRVYAAYAEFSGLRRQEDFFPTTDIRAAVEWLYPRLGSPAAAQEALLDCVDGPA